METGCDHCGDTMVLFLTPFLSRETGPERVGKGLPEVAQQVSEVLDSKPGSSDVMSVCWLKQPGGWALEELRGREPMSLGSASLHQGTLAGLMYALWVEIWSP